VEQPIPHHLRDSEPTFPGVPPVTEDALVLLRTEAPSDCLLSARLINLHLHCIIYLLTKQSFVFCTDFIFRQTDYHRLTASYILGCSSYGCMGGPDGVLLMVIQMECNLIRIKWQK